MIPQQAVETLRGTRWVYSEGAADRTGDPRINVNRQCYVVEIVEIRGDGGAEEALCVTCYSDPLRHWWVPVTCFYTPFSAFAYLGVATELSWIHVNAWLIDTNPHPSLNSDWHHAWQVEAISDAHVFMRPSRLNHGKNSPIEFITSKWRTATQEEIMFARTGPILSEDEPDEQPLPPPEPQPAPDSIPQGPVPRFGRMLDSE